MPQRTHGTTYTYNTSGIEMQHYVVYVSAPKDKVGVEINTTGNYGDISQKNFEIIVQSISLRAAPNAIDVPMLVGELEYDSLFGPAAPFLSGRGYIWRFGTEQENVFANRGPNGSIGPVGLLVDELDGIILPSGVRLTTKGEDINIEFVRFEKIHAY